MKKNSNGGLETTILVRIVVVLLVLLCCMLKNFKVYLHVTVIVLRLLHLLSRMNFDSYDCSVHVNGFLLFQ